MMIRATTPITLKVEAIVETAIANKNQFESFGFSRGFLGLSFLTYLYGDLIGDQRFIEHAKTYFDEACGMLNDKVGASFHLDLSELGILTEYLHKRGVLEVDPNEFLEDVDEIMLEQMRSSLKSGNIGGFVNGALSKGVYFLHRLASNKNSAVEALEELVEGIHMHAIQQPEGWHWKSQLNPNEERVYLTFPHGSAAVILFLTKMAEYGLSNSTVIQSIVNQSIHFLLHHEVSDRFYKFSDLLNQPEPSRLGLCYGDMGVGYALLRAGMVFKNPDWYEKGLQVLQNCALRRKPETTSVLDASILFGATGLALLFNKVYRLTNQPIFGETSDFWYGRIMDFAIQEEGFVGFRAAYNQWQMYTNLSFCEGIVGIGAGLIKSLKGDSIDFDELIWLF